MPLVLMQRAWQDDPKYKDTEFALYHYPETYFDQIKGGERFVYYRPSRGAKAVEASSYFGCGELGDWWTDPGDPTHRFVGIRKPIRFAAPVPYHDEQQRMYESRYAKRDAFQGHSVRYIDDLDFHRILTAAGLTGAEWAMAPTVDDVIQGLVVPDGNTEPPRDAFRPLIVVPDGTGYRPTGKPIDVLESAALQERARDDHQDTVKLLKALVEARGGSCDYNNNVDVLASFDSGKLLIEAKSLNNPNAAIDRMRYGMGQLFDYGVRYKDEIGPAQPILAFGKMPPREVSWIATILEGNGVAFIAREKEDLVPMNELARALRLYR